MLLSPYTCVLITRTLFAVITVFLVSRFFQVVIGLVFRLICVVFCAAVLLFDSLCRLWAILALPRFERCRFSFALELRFLLFTLTTQSVEIVRIVVEFVVFIFAAIRGLFPETVACHHTQVSYTDNGSAVNS